MNYGLAAAISRRMADTSNDLSDLGAQRIPARSMANAYDLSDLGASPANPTWRNQPIDVKSLDLSDIAKAEPEAKAYDIKDGEIHFAADKPATGLRQAMADGVIDKDYADKHLADFQRLQVKYQDFQQAAGNAQVAKAILNGAGRGAAFLAGSIPGAKGGAALGAAVPGAEEVTVPLFGAIGSLTTGTLASMAYGKAIDKLSDYNDFAKELTASAELHPVANAAGEFVAFASSAPKSIKNLAELYRVGGTKAVTAQVAKGAAAGAAFEGVIRPGFDVTKNIVADQLGISHQETQTPSMSSLAQNIGLGILTAGHHIEFRDFTGDQMANLILRAKAREAAGIPLNDDNPAAVIKGFEKLGARPTADLVSNGLLRPMDEGEIAAYADLNDKMQELRQSGQLTDNDVAALSAKQAIVTARGRRIPISRSTIELKPREQTAEPQTPTESEVINANRIEGPVAEASVAQPESVSPTSGRTEAAIQPVARENKAEEPAPAPPPPPSAPIEKAGRPLTANPNWQVTVQAPQRLNENTTVPGYVQIDDITGGDNKWSKSPKTLSEEGYTIPDFSSLPSGKYTLEQAVQKLNEQNARMPAPVPETPETVAVQMRMLKRNQRSAVLITAGETSPTVPKGFKSVSTKHGTVIYNPNKLNAEQIAQASEQDKIGEILNYGIASKPQAGTEVGAVIVRSPEGTEKQGVLTDAQNLPNVIEAAKDVASKGDSITVEPEQKVIEERKSRKPAVRKKKQPELESKWHEVGANADGNKVFEDENGVRSYVENGIRISEPVELVPTRQGILTQPSKPRTTEFETIDEKAPSPTLPANANEPAEGASGGIGHGGGLPSTPAGTGGERPTAGVAEGPVGEIQSGIRPEDAVSETGGRGGNSRIANADANGIPAEPKPEAPLIPSADTGVETSPSVRGEPTEANPAPDVEIGGPPKPQNIRLVENPAPTGAVARIKANIDAIALVKRLDAENRFPTDQERKTLAMWSGWGSFKELFNEGRAEKRDWDPGWMKRYGAPYDKLRKLLTDDEFNAAAESSVNAHYTSQEVVDSMWSLVKRLGFQGGRALEPATGSGVFVGYIPDDLASVTRWTGVEMEPMTGKIFQYLYPQVDTRIQGFESAKLPNAFYDLVITNVPFHEVGPGKEYPNLNLHNYFIARALDKVKPGGLVAVVTTSYTMDSRPDQRAFLADKGQLVGAIRLPNDAFKESASTEVVTDIIVLRKPDGHPFELAQPWQNTVQIEIGDSTANVNEYFAANPEMVLGKHALTGTMYRKNSYTVESTPGALAEKLTTAINEFPQDILQRSAPSVEPVSTQLEEGTLSLDDKGRVLEARNFQLQAPISWDSSSPSLVKRARMYIHVRDVLKQQYRMEDDPAETEAEIEANRARLNRTYQELRRELGATLNASERKLSYLSTDPDFYTVMGLEVSRERPDPKNNESTITVIEPADVLSRRVKIPDVPPTSAANAVDALGISMAYKGGLDMDYLIQLTGRTQEAIEAELISSDLGFKDPESGRFFASVEYLTGDVRDKLAKAIFAAKESDEFERNVEALKKVIPETIPFGRIKLSLTARWVPVSVFNQFAKDVIGLNGDEIRFVPGLEEFAVTGAGTRYVRISDKAKVEWSTQDMNALELLSHAMNFKRARVMRRTPDDKYVEDTNASALANQIIDKMGIGFQNWIRTTDAKVPYRYFDADRGDYVDATLPIWDTLEREFNRTKNSFVDPKNDGSLLKLPGLSNLVTRKQHLLDGVMRAIVQGSSVYGHGVGSGKTFLAIVTMHELRRIGLMKKGITVVKKPTVDQFRASIERAYPGSRVLMPSEKDFKPANRKKLTARIASGNWDFIVLTHEQFKSVRTSEASVNSFFNDQIEQLRNILREMGQADAEDSKSTRGLDPAVRNIVKKLKSLKKRLSAHTESISKKQDVGLEWEKLGVDGIWIDESHNFKKMPIPTQMDNVKGIPTDFSQRAVDLLIKIRDVQRRTNGRNVFFASGTPVSNTLAELWVMFHATNPQLLKQFGIETFDSFATAYAEVISNFELGWDMKFKDVTRMSRFKNPGSLTLLTRLGMDVRIGNKELGLDVPEIDGGKPIVRVIKPTKAFQRWLDFLNNIVGQWESLDPLGRFLNSWVPITAMRAGAAAALDPRSAFTDGEDDPNSKVNTAVRDILSEWERGKDRRTTMMVFADMYRTLNTSKLMGFVGGERAAAVTDVDVPEEQQAEQSDDTGDTSSKDSGDYERNCVGNFNLYEDIRRKLISAGVPENEIAVITEHDSDAKRAALFNKVRSGAVRVLLGSTEKIGEGVDVPQRMSAQFHLDPPMQMTPAKMEQRIGRIIRQGNLHSPKNWNIPVRIYLYAQERSMDAAIYQMLENKSIMVLQALKGQFLGDEFDDPAGDFTATMIEMKAAATGDTRVLELAKLQKEVRDLSLEEGAFQRRVSELRREVDTEEDQAQHQKREAEKYTAISNAVAAETSDKDTVVLTNKDKRYVGEKAINELLERARPAFEDALKAAGSRASLHLKLGTQVNVKVEGETKADFEGKLRTYYSAVYYIGAELNWGVPRWDSNINSIESLLNTAKQVPRFAHDKAIKAMESAQAHDRMAKQYAEAFKGTRFDKADILNEKRARLWALETELRSEGRKKTEQTSQTPTEVDVAPSLEDRIKAQIATVTQRLEKINQDLTIAEGQAKLERPGSPAHNSAIAQARDLEDQWNAADNRAHDLQRRLATVLKTKTPNNPIDLPTPPSNPQLSIDPTPTSIGEERVVRGLQELAKLLSTPASGLSEDARRVALDLLNTPAMQTLDWSNLTVAIKNRIGEGYAGTADIVQNLIELTKATNPSTFPHEIFHFLFHLLPAEDKAHVENARLEMLRQEVAGFTAGLPSEVAGLITQLQSGRMSSSDFVQILNRLRVESPEAAVWWESLYPLINPSEFLATMAGRRFTNDSFDSEEYNWFQKFIVKLGGWIRAIIDALRRLLGAKPSMEQIYREILAGKRVTSPQTAAEYETGKQGSIEGQPIENAGIDPTELDLEISQAEQEAVKEGWITTEVLGRKDSVRGRDVLTNVERAAGADYAKKIFDQSGLQVTQQQNGLWALTDPNFESEIEGRKLLEILGKEIALQKLPGTVTGYLGNLLNSVVVNMTQDAVQAFSPELKRDLYSVAQGERSQRGLALAALAGFGKSVEYVARNVDTVLSRMYSDRFGGDEIRRILADVLTEFRGMFTDAEISDILRNHPDMQNTVGKIIDMNRRDEGGRVYRRFQYLMKPKAKKKLNRLEADVRVKEAVNEMLKQAKLQGIEPVPNPNKPLSPLHTLLLLVKPENAQKVDKLIAAAISEGERNAGIKAAIKNAKDADERQDLLARFSAGEDPDEESVEAGLQMPEFAHWKALRDNLLGYSPTTLKVVQRLVQNDFRGVNYRRASAKRPADSRIDLNVLAKQPDDEVRRVLNAYAQNLDANMALQGATEETRLRVLDDVHREVAQQLERIRQRMRDPQFALPKQKGVIPTAEQRLAELINAGIFADPRLNVPEMVDRIAGKSALQSLTPNLTKLTADVFSTPFYRQDELPKRFAQELIDRLSVTPEQAQAAQKVFEAAFGQQMARARAAAFKKAVSSLSPVQRRAMKPGKGLWRKIEEAVNSGVFDAGIVLQTIAHQNGWHIPSQAEIDRIKGFADELQRLNELNAQERAPHANNPAGLEAALRDKRAATLDKRIAIKKKIEAMWAKFTHPMRVGTPEGRTNIAMAINEFTSANLLFKIGFAPRLAIDIVTQGFLHTPTRAIAAAIARYQTDSAAGRTVSLWNEINSALRDAYRVRLAATKANLVNARQALAGKGDVRNVDRLLSRIAVFERMEMKAEELAAKGDFARAGALRLLHMISFSYRVAQTLDNFQGLPAEYQEMRQQVETALRENGMTKAEAVMNADNVIGDMKAEWSLALARVQEIFTANGIEATANDIKTAAWHVVKSRQYARMKAIGLPADDFEEINRILRSTVAWAEREDGGLGGVIGGTMRLATNKLAAMGLPMPLARFSNAIATGINRKLFFTPLGFFPGAFKGSPWFRTEQDRIQRKIEASIGTSFGLLIAALVFGGILKVWIKPPQNKEERDLWEKEGHRANTIELVLPDGSFIPMSLLIGPMAVISPYAAAAGAIVDAKDKHEKAQQRLNDEAAKKGIAAGNVRDLTYADYGAIAFDTAYQMLVGNRTAAGLVSSFTDQNSLPNANKFISSVLSPIVPGLPGLQEITRMAGINLDPKMATVFDFMLPLPTSEAAKKNLLGDNVGTEDALQRISQILTGGTYPIPVNPENARLAAGYNALFASGFRPPAINPDKGYAINGEMRPLTQSELVKYTELRGQYLKQALQDLPDPSDRKAVQTAYRQANAQALESVGVDTGATRQRATSGTGQSGTTRTTSASPGAVQAVGFSTGVRRVSAIRRGLGRRIGRSSLRRSPSLRVGRGLLFRQRRASRRAVRSGSARARRRSG